MEPIREVINVSYDNSAELYNMDEMQRKIAILISKTAYNKTNTVYFEDDEKICYIFETINFHITKDGKIYGKKSKPEGFTYLKNKKKVEIWFRSANLNLKQLSIWLTYAKFDWFSNFLLKSKIKFPISAALLSRVISKKITNEMQLIKYLCQYTIKLRVAEIDTVALKKLFINGLFDGGERHISSISRIISQSSNKKLMTRKLVNCTTPEFNIFSDMVNECKVLNSSINPKWSEKRIKHEHKFQSRTIRDIQAKSLPDITYYNVKNIETRLKSKYYDLELITTNKRLFVEGGNMDHCVYNYSSDVQHGKYIIFHNHTNDSTLSLIKQSYLNSWQKSQYYGIGNTTLKKEEHKIIELLLSMPEFQSYLNKIKNNLMIHNITIDVDVSNSEINNKFQNLLNNTDKNQKEEINVLDLDEDNIIENLL